MSSVIAIALCRVKRVSHSVKKSLIDQWGTPESVWQAVVEERGTSKEEQELFRHIRDDMNLDQAHRETERIGKKQGWILSYGTEAYPSLLASISDPPLVLYGMGKLPKQQIFLAFVGSRKPTTYGLRIGRMLASDLAREGLILVSGMARGIDAVAHEAALKAGTPTVAVTGCGLDRVYPPEHAHLQARIVENGAIVTEFSLGEPPRKENFPRRNRILCGLSKGVLVIEATLQSGTRSTVQSAMDQGREVFAVPGPVDSPLSMYPNELISQGAKLVSSSADVFEELFPSDWQRRKRVACVKVLRDLSLRESEFLQWLEPDVPADIDVLVEKSQKPVQEVLSILAELEMQGLVQKQVDRRYVRIVGEIECQNL